MARFLIDENLPYSLVASLVAAGLEAEHVRDVGLRGKSDEEVLAYAVAHGMALLSRDSGFANILKYPLGSHGGIAVLRYPNELSVTGMVQSVTDALVSIRNEQIAGALLIVEPGNIRFRRQT